MQPVPSHIQDRWWLSGPNPPSSERQAVHQGLLDLSQPFSLVEAQGHLSAGRGGAALLGAYPPAGVEAYPLHAHVPALPPQALGSSRFRQAHGLRLAYIAGAMANGITSTDIVISMARAGMLGFFGSAGLSLAEVEKAIITLKQELGDLPFGFNLIHSPNEPALEMAVVELYHRYHVQLVSASAYLDLTLPLVYYRIKGIHQDPRGRIICPHRVVGKVSRIEVARKFFAPPPEKLLRTLVEQGRLTQQEATLAQYVPVAEDITAEADSGGHTDNQPSIVLTPTLMALRDACNETYNYPRPLCVGMAGGISTPLSAASAFAMGADYILTGSVNQSCLEAGTSPTVRQLLAETQQADVTMAPAADMFEMGVKVQVLKRGTMFALRARKLYELFRSYKSLDEIPAAQRNVLERDYFKATLEETWASTCSFFAKVDPAQIVRADKDPQHKMALVFRSYLGLSSKWANAGDPSRKMDYQIWCGPAMGAFNEWTKGSFLAAPEARRVDLVAWNLMVGAAYLTRINWIRSQGVTLPSSLQHFAPMPIQQIRSLLG